MTQDSGSEGETKVCACGTRFTVVRGRGRPAVHCPSCRKPRGIDRDPAATQRRSNARANAVAEAEARTALATPVVDAMRMAFALEAHSDPVKAAAFAGLTLDATVAHQLAREARKLYPDGVSNIALTGLARATLGGMLLHLAHHTAHLKPDYTAGGARAVGQLMTALAADHRPTGDGTFTFNLTSASGEPVSVVRDPATVARPKLAS